VRRIATIVEWIVSMGSTILVVFYLWHVAFFK
jgi:hypothetical protein